MSLILEALRKSEAERRRGERPSLHGQLPQAAPSPRGPIAPAGRWMLVAAAVLGIALGLYAWWARTSPAAQGLPPPTPASAPTQPAPAAKITLPPVNHLTPPVPVAPAPRAARRETPAPPASPSEPALKPPPVLSVVPVAPAAIGEADRTLHLSDLDPEQRKVLPPLKLSMHMWNDDPAQRFVILDGNRLREGDRIGDAVVTAITRDGVVLDWNGRRVLVPIR